MFVTELMLLGFISLLLTVFQGLVSHICIPTDLVSIMLPCKRETPEAKHHGDYTSSQAIYNIHRRLLSEDSSSSGHCVKKVKCMTWIFELHMDNSVFWNLNNKQLSFNLWKVTVEGKKSRLILFFFSVLFRARLHCYHWKPYITYTFSSLYSQWFMWSSVLQQWFLEAWG